jgi:hypothetical protein
MQDGSPSHREKRNQTLIALRWWDTKRVKLDEFTSLKAERDRLLQQVESLKQEKAILIEEVKQKEER